tara:strand:- start:344 stop:541 length:198 start_codon:yes stop_codon:yes gene_type:complete
MDSFMSVFDNPFEYLENYKAPIQTGPGRRTVVTLRKQIDTSHTGATVREANRRNGVGRPPKNKQV